MVRGSTRTSTGSSPMVRMASTSSASFIEPIWAAKADAERPATMIAVRRIPSSRKVARPTRLITNTSAPNCLSCTAPCWASTIPIRKLIRPMMPSAFTPTCSIWTVTALQRTPRRDVTACQAEIKVRPMNPMIAVRFAQASSTYCPSRPSSRVRKGSRFGRMSQGRSAADTSAISLSASAPAPSTRLPGRSRSRRCTIQAPTVSIRLTLERSMTSGPST